MVAVASTIASTTTRTIIETKCPRGCKCVEPSYATCDSLEFDRFGVDVRTLKITNTSWPLYLDADFLRNAGLEKIMTFVIENADIKKIDKDAFRNLTELTDIKIINSNIPEIHPDTFVYALNLGTVNFAGSKLAGFNNIKSETLDELDLSNCSLKKITNNMFDNLSELAYINLSHNRLSVIAPSTFSNLVNLEELDLSGNLLEEIPPNMFQNNTQLNTLNLSNNPLKHFHLSAVSEIERLEIRSCKLTNIDDSFSKNLDMLVYLDVSGNSITEISPKTFTLLSDLEHIDLSNNGLKTLDASIFKNNTKLKKILLDNNNLEILRPFICTASQFETYHFACNNCRLKTLDEDTFATMPAIVTLRLANNGLDNVSAIKRLHSLIQLDLSNNRISELPSDAFSRNTALEGLNLSGNPLTGLDSTLFTSNTVLKNLDVSNCGLTKLWRNTNRSLLSIQRLSAARNNLKAITQKELNITPQMTVLDVEGNPFECDQVFCNFIQWVNDQGVVQPSLATKTHEPIIQDAQFEPTVSFYAWANVVNATCGNTEKCNDDYDEYFLDDDYDDEYADSKEASKIDPVADMGKTVIGETEIDITEFKISESRQFPGRYYSYIWPALVFIFTAVMVLLIVANIMLLVLRRRGTIQMPREGLPQIKIIPWSTGTKLKKHSGSVYQPLSEDRSGPRTPMINRYEQLPNSPSVHKAIP